MTFVKYLKKKKKINKIEETGLATGAVLLLIMKFLRPCI